jgi:predicted DNA-binding transcriptional regulator AlpA
MENSKREFMSRAEVGNMLSICPHSVDKYAKDGLFPKYKIGRHVRFKWSEVVEALESSK